MIGFAPIYLDKKPMQYFFLKKYSFSQRIYSYFTGKAVTQMERQGKTEKEKLHIQWFNPHMVATPKAGPGASARSCITSGTAATGTIP